MKFTRTEQLLIFIIAWFIEIIGILLIPNMEEAIFGVLVILTSGIVFGILCGCETKE